MPFSTSTLILSPSLINKGTLMVYPVSTFACLVALVAVLPLTPGSVWMTLSTTLGGNSTINGWLSSVFRDIFTSWPSFKKWKY